MIDISELKDRLFQAELVLRSVAKTEPTGPTAAFSLGKAEGVALARSYVEEMAKW